MTTTTTNLGLTTYNTTTDGSTLFYNYVDTTSGSNTTSNMSKIDVFAGNTSASLTAISASMVNMSASLVAISGSVAYLSGSVITPASFTNANITVDALGRVTTASNGTSSGSLPFATVSDVNAGTSASLVISASSLAGSNYGTKTVFIPLNTSSSLVGTETNYIRIPLTMNLWQIISVNASCSGSSTSGSPAFTIQRSSASSLIKVNMLTTNITIDQGEYDSLTASASAVISASASAVFTGDKIWVGSSGSSNCGTGVTNSGVSVTFQNKP